MKKLYFFLFLALLGSITLGYAQQTYVPDDNFEHYLETTAGMGNGIANDNYVTTANINTKLYLNVNNKNIADLTGIEDFVALTSLDCQNNQLTSLDVSQNVNLEYLHCGFNQLTSLDVSQNVNLEYLHCGFNQLTSLDVSQNVNLEYLNCDGNQLTSLDLSQNTALIDVYCNANQLTSIDISQSNALIRFYCYDNQLTGLDVTQNTALEKLWCFENQLTSLDVSQNVNLEYLNCGFNQLTSLDVSQNTALIEFDCYYNQLTNLDVSQSLALVNLKCDFNQLTNLDVSQNSNLTWLDCNNNSLEAINIKNRTYLYTLDFSNNPNLQYVCADETDINQVQLKINAYGYSATCHVNSYCSFTPGGAFYEITGNTKFDFNTNGCDATDTNSNLKFNITNGSVVGSIISNQTGNYYIPVQSGNHTVTPNLENPNYFNISPTSFSVDFPTQASPFTRDFCVTANGIKSDLEVILVPITPARPGFDAIYKLVYRNKGNQIENGSVSLSFDNAVLDFVVSYPVYYGFTWNYSNLQPFETREIILTFNVNSPTEIPAVNNGDVLNFTATISSVNTDETPADNTFTLDQTVVGSYDPNDKTCLQGETIEPSEVGKYVHYVIRFENTGTFPAENIVVKDMIDLTKFDITTLVPLKSSHDFFTRISGNKVEFIFENINLDFNDATNDGYVAFKIKTKPTLVLGNTFTNNANIYFDYNFPITTNTYTTTIAALNTQDFDFGNYFTLYPNPAKDLLHIQPKQDLNIKSVEIYNQLGQIVLAVTNTVNTVDVANLALGTYFVKVNTEKGSANAKFVKE